MGTVPLRKRARLHALEKWTVGLNETDHETWIHLETWILLVLRLVYYVRDPGLNVGVVVA